MRVAVGSLEHLLASCHVPFITMAESQGIENILSLSRGFEVSRAVGAAAKLKLFTALGTASLTAQQLSKVLSLCRAPGFRGTIDWLDLLASVGLLHRAGKGSSAMYSNTAASAKYLVEGSPSYMGGILVLNYDRTYVQFKYLDQVLQHGELPAAAHQEVPDILTTFGHDKQAAQHFALGMTGASLENFQMLAQRFDFSRYQSLGDFGGSLGCLAVCVAQQHAGMTCTTYDLPPVHDGAVEYVQKAGLQGRVKVQDWDFFSAEPFPHHDVITMGMILHDWGIDKKQQLIAKAYAALPPGGAFIAIDTIIDDARRTNTFGLAMSLNMLVEFGTENAFDYTFQEFSNWTTEAGFSSCQLIQLVGPTSAAVAYK